MKRQGVLTSIDVGTTKVCTTIADVNETGNIRVVGVGVTPSVGLHKGGIGLCRRYRPACNLA